jgi:hypothetical protein
VNAGTGCSWSASSNASWITITSAGNATGTGVLNYSVSVNNTGFARVGNDVDSRKDFHSEAEAPLKKAQAIELDSNRCIGCCLLRLGAQEKKDRHSRTRSCRTLLGDSPSFLELLGSCLSIIP